MAAAIKAADNGSLSSLQKGLDSATGGITSKEKVAIGAGCAAVAVFAILVIWALMNRHKVSKIFKRRSWDSLRESLNGEKHRQSSGSDVSDTLSNWEKMDQRDQERDTVPRITEQSMAVSRTVRYPSTMHGRNTAGSPASDAGGEELGYDWLELASEGREGLSPNTLHQQSRFSASPRKRSFVATSILSSPGIVAKAFRIIVPLDKKVTPLQKAPLGRKKMFNNGNLASPEAARSPLSRSPLGFGGPRPDYKTPTARSPLPAGDQRSQDAAQVSASPPRTPPKKGAQGIGNPFEDPEDRRSPPASHPGFTLTRQKSFPHTPQDPHGIARHQASDSPFKQESDTPTEIEYVASVAGSSCSGSSGSFHTPSLALPGQHSPPMTPMTASTATGRVPIPSLASEPDELASHGMMARTRDARRDEREEPGQDTYPEYVGGYALEEEFSGYPDSEMDSWYTRSSTLPPNLLDSVPITQEEIRKSQSKSRNTVRFADSQDA